MRGCARYLQSVEALDPTCAKSDDHKSSATATARGETYREVVDGHFASVMGRNGRTKEGIHYVIASSASIFYQLLDGQWFTQLQT